MLSWSCPHMAWWLLLILYSWVSVQRLPLMSLQEAHILFQYIYQVVCIVTSSVLSTWHSVQRLCLYQSWPYPPLMSLSQMRPDLWYSLSFLPEYHHQIQWWLWLDWKGAGRFLLLLLFKAGPASGTNLGMSSSPCAELCSLLALTSWELTQVLLSWWLLSELLEEWSHLFCVGTARNSANGHPTGGVPTKGISSNGDTGSGGVLGVWAGLLEGPGACDPSSSDAVVVAGTFSSCCVVLASALLM